MASTDGKSDEGTLELGLALAAFQEALVDEGVDVRSIELAEDRTVELVYRCSDPGDGDAVWSEIQFIAGAYREAGSNADFGGLAATAEHEQAAYGRWRVEEKWADKHRHGDCNDEAFLKQVASTMGEVG